MEKLKGFLLRNIASYPVVCIYGKVKVMGDVFIVNVSYLVSFTQGCLYHM